MKKSFVLLILASIFVSAIIGCKKNENKSNSTTEVGKTAETSSPKLIGSLDMNDDVFDAALKLRTMGCEEITIHGDNGAWLKLEDKSKTTDQQEKDGIMDWIATNYTGNYGDFVNEHPVNRDKKLLDYKDVRDRLKLDEFSSSLIGYGRSITCKNLLISDSPTEVEIYFKFNPKKLSSNKHAVYKYNNKNVLFSNSIMNISFKVHNSNDSVKSKFRKLANDFGSCKEGQYTIECGKGNFSMLVLGGDEYNVIWNLDNLMTDSLIHDFSNDNKPRF